MSDRLNELRHQRALAQEQLVWLDREIARETGDKETTPAVPLGTLSHHPPAVASLAAPKSPLRQEDIDAEAARILAQFNPRGRSPQDEVKRGCIIYFLAAMTLMILGMGAYMMWKYW